MTRSTRSPAPCGPRRRQCIRVASVRGRLPPVPRALWLGVDRHLLKHVKGLDTCVLLDIGRGCELGLVEVLRERRRNDLDVEAQDVVPADAILSLSSLATGLNSKTTSNPKAGMYWVFTKSPFGAATQTLGR